MPSCAHRWFRRSTLAWLLVGLLSAVMARAETLVEDPPNPLTLAWCLERAAEANPDIASQAAAAAAAQHRIGPAGALDDPRATMDIMSKNFQDVANAIDRDKDKK